MEIESVKEISFTTFDKLVASKISMGQICLVLMFIYALVDSLIHNFSYINILTLIACPVSIVVVWLYIYLMIDIVKGKSWKKFLIAIAMLIINLYAAFIFFYMGAWGVVASFFGGFDLFNFIRGLIFILFGHTFGMSLLWLTECQKSLASGKLIRVPTQN